MTLGARFFIVCSQSLSCLGLPEELEKVVNVTALLLLQINNIYILNPSPPPLPFVVNSYFSISPPNFFNSMNTYDCLYIS